MHTIKSRGMTKVLAAAAGGMLVLPLAANATVDLAGDELQAYGKLHVSVDVSDTDKTGSSSDASISSNSSRLGFKGSHAIDAGVSVIWQLEQEVKPDEGSGNFSTRNSFIGLKGAYGALLLGHHDTPYKTVGSKWGMFGDSAGERRAILGASALDGNQLNQRAKNALLYTNSFGPVKVQLMYATDPQDSATGAVDNNDNDMSSVAVMYHEGPWSFAVAQESWSALGAFGGVDGLRVSAGYHAGAMKFGAIYESTDGAAVSPQWNRDVLGVNAAYQLGDTSFRVQYLTADDYQGVTDSGAAKTAIGAFKKLDKVTEVYLTYALTDNDANAKFQAVDGGHGDEVKTDLGGSPSSFSAGLVYKF